MIRPCAFINFLIYSTPVRLLSPVRLLGTPEYINYNRYKTLFVIANDEAIYLVGVSHRGALFGRISSLRGWEN